VRICCRQRCIDWLRNAKKAALGYHRGFFIFKLLSEKQTMSLKDTIQNDIKDAMRAKDAAKLTPLRMLTAAIKQREVDERIELADADVIALIQKQIKQRRESITAYEKGNRPELVASETAEVVILEKYLPQQMSDAEMDAAITAAIAEAGVAPGGGGAAMGKVMGILKPKLAGKADMQKVSAMLKAKLG
jgi:uncharacterized protein